MGFRCLLLDNKIQNAAYSSSDFKKTQQNQIQGIPWINHSFVLVRAAKC